MKRREYHKILKSRELSLINLLYGEMCKSIMCIFVCLVIVFAMHLTIIKIRAMKNVNPVGAYRIDYVRFIANAFNFMLGRFAYFSSINNRPIREIIVTDSDMAKSIGCHPKHSSVVLKQMRDIFDLKFERMEHRGGARKIKLNDTVIDFLHVFNETQLNNYIEQRNISDPRLVYALVQLYRYRVWTLPVSKLSPAEKIAQEAFLDAQRDYLHRVASANRSVTARYKLIESHSDILGERDRRTLKIIGNQLKDGDRLEHHWMMRLIALEQRVSAYIRVKDTKTPANEPVNHVDREQSQAEDVDKKAASLASRKIPEDEPVLQPNDYIDILIKWNNMIGDQAIPKVESLSKEIITSINRMNKLYGKEGIIDRIMRVAGLKHDRKKYKHKITLERFMKPETFEHIDRLKLKQNLEIDWLNDYMAELGVDVVKSIDPDDVPTFESIEEAQSWWKQTI